MMQHSRTSARNKGSTGLLALFPLVLVAAAIALLGFGAGRVGRDTQARDPAPAASVAADASISTAEEEAAAAAIVAISLARVAPALPEEALEPPKPKPPQPAAATPAEPARKAAPRREAATGQAATGQGATGQGATGQAAPGQAAPAAPMPIGRANEPAAPAGAAMPKPEEQGILSRIGSYAPSPKKIVSAVGDGVSKLASYIPGL